MLHNPFEERFFVYHKGVTWQELKIWRFYFLKWNHSNLEVMYQKSPLLRFITVNGKLYKCSETTRERIL